MNRAAIPIFVLLSLAGTAACGRVVAPPASTATAPLPVADVDETPADDPDELVTARVPPLSSAPVEDEEGEDDGAPPPPPDYVIGDPSGLPPPPGEPQPLVVYLSFRGETFTRGARGLDNARDNTTDLLGVDEAVVPPMSGQSWGLPPHTVVDQIIGYLLQDFAPWHVTFVTTRPNSGDYTLVALGGEAADLGVDVDHDGYAPLDVGNANPNDVAFVFTHTLSLAGASVRAVATVVAHELGHTLGLRHIDRPEDIMAAARCGCLADWGAGSVVAGEGAQDDEEVLASVLPPAPTAPPPPPAPPPGEVDCFADIADSWAAADICTIFELGITHGCEEDAFCPAEEVTRAQMAVFLDRLYQAATGEVAESDGTPFVDVPAAHWASDAVARIYALGITLGVDDQHFAPEAAVTRGQMAAFLDRAWQAVVGATPPAVSTPFVDTADHFAALSIARIYGLGITQGTDDTHFSPDRAVTREQMAAFLARTWASLP